MLEQNMKTFILMVGWPLLILMSVAILQKAYNFYSTLKKTILGKLILPTVLGWLFGMYALGIVASAYMLSWTWYFTVIPVFAVFIGAIIMVFITMDKWEKEATDLQSFYTNLEVLVKKRTAELEEAHDKAIRHEKEIQELKDQFVFIAAHELRTPVTAIKWGLESALEEGPKRIGKDLYDQLVSVQGSNERLINLVEDLLNVARIESKTIKLNISECNLVEIAEQLLKEQRPTADARKIVLNSELPKHLMMLSDPVRIKQIVTNLLSNAIKYNREKGSVTLVFTAADDESVKFSVADTGIGIAGQDLPKLFTKFGRIRTKETAEIEGTGLGLFVTKELIEQLGGTITVTSEVGVGTKFEVKLPKVVA
jgi:signal transduction histidine kinase